MSVFKSCGVMFDMSRCGVMSVSTLEKYIPLMSKMGIDTFYAYMEDTYELKDCPFFGYMRGRYSENELRAIDKICSDCGVQFIPCIQTLGHLAQYLRYQQAKNVRDTLNELLCGVDETYALIESMIKTMRNCISGKKLHIGMDEAFGIGTGRYHELFGHREKSEIFREHLVRVCEICKKYDFIPMIWDDVAISLLKSGDKDSFELPDVEFVPWMYGCRKETPVKTRMDDLKKFDRPITFAGTAWTYCSLLPRYNYAQQSILPTAQAAAKNGASGFMLTLWGDDGCMTNYLFALPQIMQLGYYNTTGIVPDAQKLHELSEEYGIIDYNFCNIAKIIDQPKGYDTDVGKRIFFGDILLNSGRVFIEEYANIFKKAAEEIVQFINRNDDWKDFYIYAQLCFEIVSLKTLMVTRLQKAYKANDVEFIKYISHILLPTLKEKFTAIEKIHRKIWLQTYKPIGYQRNGARYGAQFTRIDYAQDRLNDYLAGNIDVLPELEETQIQCIGDNDMDKMIDGDTIFIDYEKWSYGQHLIDVCV